MERDVTSYETTVSSAPMMTSLTFISFGFSIQVKTFDFIKGFYFMVSEKISSPLHAAAFCVINRHCAGRSCLEHQTELLFMLLSAKSSIEVDKDKDIIMPVVFKQLQVLLTVHSIVL